MLDDPARHWDASNEYADLRAAVLIEEWYEIGMSTKLDAPQILHDLFKCAKPEQQTLPINPQFMQTWVGFQVVFNS